MNTDNLVLKSLIQNWKFEPKPYEDLPPADDVISENFANNITIAAALRNNEIVVTLDENIMSELDDIAPRLEIMQRTDMYPHPPQFFVAVGATAMRFAAFIVKRSENGRHHWFDFTDEETAHVAQLLMSMESTRPYRTFRQRLLDFICFKRKRVFRFPPN